MTTRSHGDEIGGGDRHGPAEAIADQRGGLADAAQQRQQQLLDMPGDGQLAPRRPPLPQSSSSARRPMPATALGQRNLSIEVEDPRRIDQRRDRGSPAARAAMVAQARAANARDFGLRCAAALARAALSYARSPASASRASFGSRSDTSPHQFEEQRQRPRRAFMLQRTMLR